jgi:uncharacterized protein YuzE
MRSGVPFITYDTDTDSLYIYLGPPEEYLESADHYDGSDEIDFGRNVDYNRSGEVIGLEFLEASNGIRLDGMPEADRAAEAIRILSRLTMTGDRAQP